MVNVGALMRVFDFVAWSSYSHEPSDSCSRENNVWLKSADFVVAESAK